MRLGILLVVVLASGVATFIGLLMLWASRRTHLDMAFVAISVIVTVSSAAAFVGSGVWAFLEAAPR